MNETPQQYTERIIGYLGDKEPLGVLSKTAEYLKSVIHRVPSSILQERQAAGRWSVIDIITHLAESEIVTGYRLRLILGSPGIPIVAYDQDEWSKRGHYEQRDPRDSVQEFRAMREANLRWLRLLTPEQWKNHGVHSERGNETIEHLVRMTAGHDINHIQQIERILAGKGTAPGQE